MSCRLTALTVLLATVVPVLGDEPPVPKDRTSLKRFLAGERARTPRLPLPKLTDEESEKLGRYARFGNLQMRYAYLPAELRWGDFSPKPDPAMTLDPAYKTRLFWIVSRINHCAYCLGHQEEKLSTAGMSDEAIGWLDVDWSKAPAAEQAAYELTRTLTFSPHQLSCETLDLVRKFHGDLGALEIVWTVSNNNATNRWTGTLAIPQDWFMGDARPTSADLASRESALVALVTRQETDEVRPPLDPREEVDRRMAEAAKRRPCIPPLGTTEARRVLGDLAAAGAVPAWMRMTAHFPVAGPVRVRSLATAEKAGELPALLKAKIAWLAARHDRAWYALEIAERRLEALGLDRAEWEQIARPAEDASPADRAALELARKITVRPASIRDEDVARVREHFSDRQTAEIILHAANAAFFDRFTEALQLPIEPRGQEAVAADGSR